MIFPDKYELVKSSSIVIGGNILQLLMLENEIEVFTLFKKLDDSVTLNKYFDILTFFFFLDIIKITDNVITLNK